MKKIATVLMFVPMVANAEPGDFVEPVLIVGAVLAVQQIPAFDRICYKEPCNTLSHAATGYLISHYVGKKYGWEMGLLAAVAVGVGKELLDKNFDTKDAVATSFAGIQYRIVWEF